MDILIKARDAPPLLASKFYLPPARPNLVHRPRLVQQLEAGLGGPVTLISAPAGSGKTTLVGELVASQTGRDNNIAWLSLDAEDNDPGRFLTYLIAALRTLDPGLCETTLALLGSPQPPPLPSILALLASELEQASQPFVLALDDYHHITEQAVHTAITFLLEHLPGQAHLVLITRADPPLPLARWRARQQLTEIRAADLRFTLDEAADFLNQATGLALPPEYVNALEQRTEGWIAGLQLAALSMQGTDRQDIAGFIADFTGSHRFIVDYLVEEVLDQQPEALSAFLLQTSILERLTASLCDEVVGTFKRSNEILEYLERANLFIVPLDHDRRWYRYHPLFADVLSNRLRRSEPELVPELHARAAGWYERHGFAGEAIHHALAAGDQELAADIVERNAAGMLMRGEMVTLLRWLKAIEDRLPGRPNLCIAQAWALAFTGRLEEIEPWLGAVERYTGVRSSKEQPVVQDWQGDVSALRAFMAAAQGDASRAAGLAQQALQLLPPDNLAVRGVVNLILGSASWSVGDPGLARQALAEAGRIGRQSGNPHLAISALYGLANLHLNAGELRQAEKTFQEAIQLATGPNGRPMPLAAEAFTGLGNLQYEWNDLGAAARSFEQGLELSRLFGRTSALAASQVSLARLRQATGDDQGAFDLLQAAELTARSSLLNPGVEILLVSQKMRFWLSKGETELAARLAREHELDTGGDLHLLHEMGYLALLRVHLAQGRPKPVLALSERLLLLLEASGRKQAVLELLILKSLALRGNGDLLQARETLARALSLAERAGYVRTFLDEGEPLRSLLSDFSRQAGDQRQVIPIEDADRLVPYASRLLAAFRIAGSGSPASAQAAPHAPEKLVEPLSERELEVLRWVAAGKSNREIAAELVLATGTVKRHLNNIFGKLEAHSRTQCVARARELGLL